MGVVSTSKFARISRFQGTSENGSRTEGDAFGLRAGFGWHGQVESGSDGPPCPRTPVRRPGRTRAAEHLNSGPRGRLPGQPGFSAGRVSLFIGGAEGRRGPRPTVPRSAPGTPASWPARECPAPRAWDASGLDARADREPCGHRSRRLGTRAADTRQRAAAGSADSWHSQAVRAAGNAGTWSAAVPARSSGRTQSCLGRSWRSSKSCAWRPKPAVGPKNLLCVTACA
jgi:hypothetical protein